MDRRSVREREREHDTLLFKPVAAPAGSLAPALPPAPKAAEDELFWWNLGLGVVQMQMAILVAALSSERVTAFRMPIVTAFTDWSTGVPVATVVHRGTIPFAELNAVFAYMAAVAHFVTCVFFESYRGLVREGRNAFRWGEYAFSSSLLIMLVAMLFGVWDLSCLVGIFFTNCAMNLFWLLMESTNARVPLADANWAPFWYGAVIGLAPWVIILITLAVTPGVASIPAWSWAALGAALALFLSFPAHVYARFKRLGWWDDAYWGYANGAYIFGEKVYVVQSLLAKSAVMWIVFQGASSDGADPYVAAVAAVAAAAAAAAGNGTAT